LCTKIHRGLVKLGRVLVFAVKEERFDDRRVSFTDDSNVGRNMLTKAACKDIVSGSVDASPWDG
jgi:hypothetical protein